MQKSVYTKKRSLSVSTSQQEVKILCQLGSLKSKQNVITSWECKIF